MGGWSRQKEIDIMNRAAAALSQTARRPESYYISYLRQPGTQSRLMNVDGSVTAVTFEWIAPTDTYLMRIGGILVDGRINLDGFMGLSAALTNGVLMRITDGSEAVVNDITDGDEIKQTVDLVALSTVDINVAFGNNDDLLTWSLAFDELGAVMYLPENYRVQMVVQDDLTALTLFESRIVAMTKAGSPSVVI